MRKALLTAVAVCSLVAASSVAGAQEKLKIGMMATLSGALTSGGEDGVRGVQVALKQLGNKIAGREVELIIATTDASPDSALRAARKLVEQDKVQVIVGPLSGSEGIAIRDYSKTVPNVTVVDGSSGALETTYVNPSPNYFRFNSNGAMWMAGLGEYVFKDKGFKKIAVIAEDYSFPYTQVFGFALGYCSAGGQITQRQWVPLGTKDFGSVIANIPDDVDAVFLGLGGGDAVNFLNQYSQTGGNAKFVGGSIMVDQTVLSSKGAAKKLLVGTPSSGGVADAWDDPRWKAWVKSYQDAFPPDKRFASPSLFATNYYNAFTALATGLAKVNADLSDGGAKLRTELAKVELDAPNGKIKLDDDRQAIATTFITEVAELPNGELTNKFVRIVPNVSKTMGLSPEAFKAVGLPSRTNPECKK
ncbi:ABC transporter substrate-binding protein [Bosea vaviloviae]|uniref:ABC transporter substrate-binding protein n=1 Tax=Bosea vaviloviae TaxID=1526658 RepID=A0A1D7TX29_9HYPH|nr:ABC transporter substrate-binding protein [Bosea vaviloviae]AOO79681.1 ABC transporter substrate-binding protein [Bosea vaviloviae]